VKIRHEQFDFVWDVDNPNNRPAFAVALARIQLTAAPNVIAPADDCNKALISTLANFSTEPTWCNITAAKTEQPNCFTASVLTDLDFRNDGFFHLSRGQINA